MIKRLDPSDLSLLRLAEKSFSELRQIYTPTSNTLRSKAMSAEDWIPMGYYSNNTLAGVIKVKLVGRTLRLSSLAVAPEHRKKGVARRLISATELLYGNAERLSVWCVEQTGNTDFFESLGFNVVERIESDIFQLVDRCECAIEVRLERVITR